MITIQHIGIFLQESWPDQCEFSWKFQSEQASRNTQRVQTKALTEF
jgi:hypothetical protein